MVPKGLIFGDVNKIEPVQLLPTLVETRAPHAVSFWG